MYIHIHWKTAVNFKISFKKIYQSGFGEGGGGPVADKRSWNWTLKKSERELLKKTQKKLFFFMAGPLKGTLNGRWVFFPLNILGRPLIYGFNNKIPKYQ